VFALEHQALAVLHDPSLLETPGFGCHLGPVDGAGDRRERMNGPRKLLTP
jgi:hypothetical protein